MGQPVWEYKLKNQTFGCVSIYRPDNREDCEPIVYATCTDKSLREIKTISVKSGETITLKAKEIGRYEDVVNYS